MNETITTADRREASEGDRVFDFYDGHWGTVGTIDADGWFDHIREDGGRGYLNGERVCVRIPEGNPFYATHGDGAREEWLVEPVHHHCVTCNECASRAIDLARATGSTGGTSTEANHGARVTRREVTR